MAGGTRLLTSLAELLVPELTELQVKGNRRVVKRYGAERTHPSTDLTEADGIGGWRVGGGEVM